MFFLEEFTRFGRYVRAIEDNEKVAESLGVPIGRCKTLSFMLSVL
ncbi:hypothetical protein DRJ00_08485 [Candidatus Aerophobetes bacterium]|uniref:Uncharacterized protein n=1 Tax=Aerophobetes bacterium TaxID=2030807 RepID=A0A497E210_UNCAE|nr:MAG: hypothetical protein DRJ00_08485 [Candidatus Aerophobetes bacterium]